MAVYQADHVGFARLMLSDEIGDMVERKAHELAAEMRATAPRGKTGVYATRFQVDTGVDIVRGERRAAFVSNDSRQATALEVGSWNIKNPPMPMTRVLQRSSALDSIVADL